MIDAVRARSVSAHDSTARTITYVLSDWLNSSQKAISAIASMTAAHRIDTREKNRRTWWFAIVAAPSGTKSPTTRAAKGRPHGIERRLQHRHEHASRRQRHDQARHEQRRRDYEDRGHAATPDDAARHCERRPTDRDQHRSERAEQLERDEEDHERHHRAFDDVRQRVPDDLPDPGEPVDVLLSAVGLWLHRSIMYRRE